MSDGVLVDTSVWARSALPAVREALAEPLRRGRVHTCGPVELELGVGARTLVDHRATRLRWRVLQRVPLDDAVVLRTQEVQEGLVERGHHRGVRLPDLLIAACAESAGLEVLHYDHDYDLIAEVTGQPVRWVAERGSLD